MPSNCARHTVGAPYQPTFILDDDLGELLLENDALIGLLSDLFLHVRQFLAEQIQILLFRRTRKQCTHSTSTPYALQMLLASAQRLVDQTDARQSALNLANATGDQFDVLKARPDTPREESRSVTSASFVEAVPC